MHGRPRFAKFSIAMTQRSRLQPSIRTSVPSAGRLSLMEYADEPPINLASSRLFDNVGFYSSRSDLSCHHIMIARVIGGSVFLFATRFMVVCSHIRHGRFMVAAILPVANQRCPYDSRILVGQRYGRGFVAARIGGRAEPKCEVQAMLRGRRIGLRQRGDSGLFAVMDLLC